VQHHPEVGFITLSPGNHNEPVGHETIRVYVERVPLGRLAEGLQHRHHHGCIRQHGTFPERGQCHEVPVVSPVVEPFVIGFIKPLEMHFVSWCHKTPFLESK
jgi:hypothetical protein